MKAKMKTYLHHPGSLVILILTILSAVITVAAPGSLIGAFVPKFADEGWTIGLPFWGGIQESGGGQFFGYVIFMLFVAWVAYNGIDQIKWVQNIGSPILIVVMIGLLFWAYSITPDGTGFFEVMSQPSDDALIEASGGFAFVYLTGLMGNIAFWATMALNIPDFSRYAKTQKDQFRGQLYGMPLPMAACAFIGAYFSQATKMAYGEAMFDPTFPARIKHMIEDENSSSRISRVVYPTTKRGIQGLSIFNLIWIQITAPIKKEINSTMPIELIPNCTISFRYCLKYIRKRSGRENTRPINMRYFPRFVTGFIILLQSCLTQK